MAKYYYASPQFPFAKVFPIGIVLIIIGVISLVLGITDVIYTAIKYTGLGCDPLQQTVWECPIPPCNSVSLPWALAAPAIWCGLLILLAGSLSTSLMYASSASIKGKRDASGVLVGLVGFPICPMALVICSLRLYYMNGTFFCLNQDIIKVTDYLEFIMPIVQAIIMFLGWCLAIAVLVALCRKGTLTQRDQLEYDYSRRYRTDYKNPRMNSLQRPFVYASNESLPQPTVWRDRSAGYQNPYMYARSEQPQYVYALSNERQHYPYLSHPGPRPASSRRWYTTENTYNRY